MNPVLIFFILVGAVLLWFSLAFAFRLIGGIISRMSNDVKRAMFEEEDNENEEL